MTQSGFALAIISSKFVNVGQSTPISAFVLTAAFTSTRPPPWSMMESDCAPSVRGVPSAERMFVAVLIIAVRIMSGVQSGCACFKSAATPETCGHAKLVPCEVV